MNDVYSTWSFRKKDDQTPQRRILKLAKSEHEKYGFNDTKRGLQKTKSVIRIEI